MYKQQISSFVFDTFTTSWWWFEGSVSITVLNGEYIIRKDGIM